MKHLTNFFQYLKENDEYSLDDVNDMLIPIDDIGVDKHIKEGVVSSGKYEGDKFISISFLTYKLEKTSASGVNYISDYISDDKIWELLDEIVLLKRRALDLENFKDCLINFTDRINLLLIIENKGEVDELLNLSNRMRAILNKSKTDFSYDTIISYSDGVIKVRTSSYSHTERKLKSLIKKSLNDIKMSDISIDERPAENMNEVITLITLKNS